MYNKNMGPLKLVTWVSLTITTSLKIIWLIEIALENVYPVQTTEIKGVLEALSRIAAKDIFSPIDNPPFEQSLMDGYALIAEDSIGASREKPVKLKVVGKIFAGDCCDMVLKPNQAIRIMTGAMIPTGANCVIKQESTNYGSIR